MFSFPGALVAILLLVHHAFAVRIPFQRVRRNTIERRNGISKVSVLATTGDDDALNLRYSPALSFGPAINRVTAPFKTCCIWLMHVYLSYYHFPSADPVCFRSPLAELVYPSLAFST
jgi:hypothetical protein